MRLVFSFFCCFTILFSMPVFAGTQIGFGIGEAIINQAQGEQAQKSDVDVPAYLREGNHNCLNMSAVFTPDAASCRQLFTQALSARGCNADIFDTNGRLKYDPGICFGGNMDSTVNRRPIVNAIVAFRKNKIASLSEDPLADAETITFDIGGQPFVVPTAFEKTVRGALASQTGTLRVWSNLTPLKACPETAFIVATFEGADPFRFWRQPAENELELSRRVAQAILQGAGRACGTSQDWGKYEIIVHALHNGTYMTTSIVPPEEAGDDGLGFEYLISNFAPAVSAYANSN